MMKNDNNILSLRIKQIEFLNPPRHRNAQQEVEQSICESELRREASLFGESLKRPIFLLTWSRRCHAVSRCHDKQYKCHTLSDGQILSRYCQAVSIHWLPHRDFLKCTQSRSERLCQCSVSFHWQWSIKCQDSESTCPVSQVPTWDASCLTPGLSQWPPILGADARCVCVPGCHSPTHLK